MSHARRDKREPGATGFTSGDAYLTSGTSPGIRAQSLRLGVPDEMLIDDMIQRTLRAYHRVTLFPVAPSGQRSEQSVGDQGKTD